MKPPLTTNMLSVNRLTMRWTQVGGPGLPRPRVRVPVLLVLMLAANPCFPKIFHQIYACKLLAFFPKPSIRCLLNVNFFRYDFTSGFQDVVDAYKRLPVPPKIKAELEITMAIEVEETQAPEIDYSSVKEFLRRQPLPKKAVERRNLVKRKEPALMLDFRSVREVVPLALPKVTITYICREKVTVANEWNLMLLQSRDLSYCLGILFYLPGTELWSFVDIFVPGSPTQSTLAGNQFELPLDLIAWQVFDFFTRRVVNHELDIKQGFAPFSLSCPDEILAKLLSSLFLDLGLPSERQIKVSEQKQIPMRYQECTATLPNERATHVPVGSFKTMLTCASCFRLFTRMDTNPSLRNVCPETCEGNQQNSGNIPPDSEYLQDKEVNSERDPKGPNPVVFGIPRLAVGHLPQSFHFIRKRDTELVEKRRRGGLSKGNGDLRLATIPRTRLRNGPLVLSEGPMVLFHTAKRSFTGPATVAQTLQQLAEPGQVEAVKYTNRGTEEHCLP